MAIIFQRFLHPTAIHVGELYPSHAKSLPTPNISNLKEAFGGDQGAQQNLLLGENPSLVQSKDSKEL